MVREVERVDPVRIGCGGHGRDAQRRGAEYEVVCVRLLLLLLLRGEAGVDGCGCCC